MQVRRPISPRRGAPLSCRVSHAVLLQPVLVQGAAESTSLKKASALISRSAAAHLRRRFRFAEILLLLKLQR